MKMQVIPNIACDNASHFKIMCQKVTGEASNLTDMLIRQENLLNLYQGLLFPAGNSSGASSQGWRRTTGDLTARRRPPALKAVSLQHLAKAKQLTHPKSASSYLHLWSTPLTRWHHKLHCKDREVWQISTDLLLLHFKVGHKHYHSFVHFYFSSSQEDSSLVKAVRCCSSA